MEDDFPSLVFRDISWQEYEALLSAGEERGIRITYFKGLMEVISPLGTTELHHFVERFEEENHHLVLRDFETRVRELP